MFLWPTCSRHPVLQGKGKNWTSLLQPSAVCACLSGKHSALLRSGQLSGLVAKGVAQDHGSRHKLWHTTAFLLPETLGWLGSFYLRHGNSLLHGERELVGGGVVVVCISQLWLSLPAARSVLLLEERKVSPLLGPKQACQPGTSPPEGWRCKHCVIWLSGKRRKTHHNSSKQETQNQQPPRKQQITAAFCRSSNGQFSFS